MGSQPHPRRTGKTTRRAIIMPIVLGCQALQEVRVDLAINA